MIPIPLRPWAWCVGWLTLIWVIFIIMDCNIRYQSRLVGLVEIENPSVNVVALGDSVLGYSLSESVIKKDQLDENIEWKYWWFKLGYWRNLEGLLNNKRTDKLKLIILQDNLFLKRNFPNTNILIRVRKILGSFIKKRNYKNPEMTTPSQRTSLEIKDKKEQYQEEYRLSYPIDPAIFVFLNKIKLIAENIVVMHLPRSQELQADPEQLHWMQLLEKQLPTMGVSFIVLGKPMPADYYYDGSHLNKKGRGVRSRQFFTQIREFLQ